MKLNIAHKILIFLAIFTIFHLLKTQNVQADIYNYAPNPSFEDGATNPEGWIPVSGISCDDNNPISYSEKTWDNTISRTGNKSLSLKNITWNGAIGTIPGGWMTSNYIPVDLSLGTNTVSARLHGSNLNNGLGVNLWLCLYDINNLKVGYLNLNYYNIVFGNGWEKTWLNFTNSTGNISKVKIGLSARCTYKPCSGSVWFDDVSLRSPGSTLELNFFEDINKNFQKDNNETYIESMYEAYDHYDCVEKNDQQPYIAGTYLGKSTIYGLRAGEYSFKAMLDNELVNTTPICQNILILPTQLTQKQYIYFGAVHKPTFPYFSQLDTQWAQEQYDSANSIGPFFCGSTIGGCGCAITSSAMLLKYYGVDKAPNGEPTNPYTLNTWLNQNKGYAFGALKWNSIAAYSLKANQAYGTQKLMFKGVKGPNDFVNLDNELNNQRPTILQQPGHFIVAHQKNGSDYSIADPAFQNKATLSSYNNQFNSLRLFEKTNTDLSAIQISAPAPAELFITDELGRRVGKDPQTGIIYNEIPDSYYILEPALQDQSQPDPTIPDPSQGVNTLVILTPQTQTLNLQIFGPSNFSIDFSAYNKDGDIITSQFNNLPNTQPQNFEINYSPEAISQFNIQQIVDVDIKPGTEINSVNPNSNGVLPVAVLTTEDFDATTIDPQTIKFGPNQIGETHDKAHWQDVNNDGKLDALLHFSIHQVGLSNLTGTVPVLCLNALTIDKIPIKGCDQIRLVT